MMSRKGQAAMEFLMTYGWAILIAIIAIAALIAFGVLNPPVQEVCGTGGVLIQGVPCATVTASTGGNMSISITNSVAGGQTLDITSATFVFTSPGSGTCTFDAVNITNGATSTMASNCVPANSAGKMFKGDFSFTYSTDGGVTTTPSGPIRIIEKISN